MINGFRKLTAGMMLPILANVLFVTQVLPAQAAGNADPLATVSSVISNPVYSNCFVQIGCPSLSYTNVSYTFNLTNQMTFNAQNPCLNTQNGCVTMTIDLDNGGPTYEQWSQAVTSTDITFSGPANAYVVSATPSIDSAQLTVALGCTAACTFASSTDYSMDIVNSPLAAPADFQYNGNGVYKAYTEIITFDPLNNDDLNGNNQGGQVVNNYGRNLTIDASVDARVGFNFQGKDAVDDTFYNDTAFTDSTDSACAFGTMSPLVPKICLWDLNISTNAANGYSIYVVQDQNMTFNGNTIKQFRNGSRRDEADASVWSSPSLNAQAHLGYSSDDQTHHGGDLFLPQGGAAVWAGIPTMVTAGQVASNPLGLVADDDAPGDYAHIFALKLETNTTLPQAPASLNQEYSNNLYFIVVGNF